MLSCRYCLRISNLYRQFLIVAASAGHSDLFRPWSFVSSPLEKVSWKVTSSRCGWKNSCRPSGFVEIFNNNKLKIVTPLFFIFTFNKTAVAFLVFGATLVASFVSRNITLTRYICYWYIVRCKAKKFFFTISITFKNITKWCHMHESVCSSDFDFQKFTWSRAHNLGRCFSSQETIKPFPLKWPPGAYMKGHSSGQWALKGKLL